MPDWKAEVNNKNQGYTFYQEKVFKRPVFINILGIFNNKNTQNSMVSSCNTG